jgi:transposase, IS5 family
MQSEEVYDAYERARNRTIEYDLPKQIPNSQLIVYRAARKITTFPEFCAILTVTIGFGDVDTMGQFGFFDADKRLAGISAKGDPLEMIDRVVPFESFRAEIEAATLTPASEKKSNAGRKPIDVVVMFRMLVLQSLYNLSDEQIEYQVRDRLSFTRFVRLGIEDSIPDGTTLWLFRETLAKAGLIEKLFERFGQHLEAKGYIARGGQMVDATIVPVPKQRNSRDENEDVKAGKTPRAWKKDPSKNRQKDKDARWTKKHGKSFYGYKNHVNADARHKLIRQYDVTDASVHDSQKFDGLLNKTNTSADVYADSAYRSAETEAKLRVRGLRSQIHQRASRNHPLSKAQENANRKKSKIRARVEHVFGAQQTSPGGRIIRTIGIARAKAKIGLQNLAYNIRRLVTLERMAAA